MLCRGGPAYQVLAAWVCVFAQRAPKRLEAAVSRDEPGQPRGRRTTPNFAVETTRRQYRYLVSR
jgi:hypothetical protein